jgi:hypothetical protein
MIVSARTIAAHPGATQSRLVDVRELRRHQLARVTSGALAREPRLPGANAGARWRVRGEAPSAPKPPPCNAAAGNERRLADVASQLLRWW